MERTRSFICLRCGKPFRVSWDAYQQLKRDPICDACRNTQEADPEFENESTEFVDSLNLLFSKLNRIVAENKGRKKDK